MNTALKPALLLIGLCVSSRSVLGMKIPPGVEPCHKSNVDFDKCVAEQMSKALFNWKDGIPELGIPRLQPFEIPKFEMIPNPSSSIALTQKYEHTLTYGIYISEVYDAKYNLKKGEECTWDFWVLTPNINVEADYSLKGQLLVFPVNAQGRSNITIKNLRNHHRVWLERYEKKGKTHLRVIRYILDMQVEAIHFDFENLVPGNKQMSDQILKSMNENSLDIYKEMKSSFESVWTPLHLQAANNLLSKVSEDEAFPK